MKTLKELGESVTFHKKDKRGKLRLAKCSCGMSHLFYALPTTEYVDCSCGMRVELCKN